jgi:hypothetical protein
VSEPICLDVVRWNSIHSCSSVDDCTDWKVSSDRTAARTGAKVMWRAKGCVDFANPLSIYGLWKIWRASDGLWS